jgi:hypothetical protein
MFYTEHTMNDGYIVRTYHTEGESLPTTEEIQKQYQDGLVQEWHFIIDPDRKFAEVVFENFSLRETVGTCHVEEVDWINAETCSQYDYQDVQEYQIQEDDVCRNGKPMSQCKCC